MTATMYVFLSDEERESFRDYATKNQHEPDGAQSRWADYTLRLLGERDHLSKSRDTLYESFAAIERERDAAIRDLDRLAGPVCPHDQRRAIEHRREQLGTVCTFIDNPQDPMEEWGPECGVLESDHGNDDHDFQPLFGTVAASSRPRHRGLVEGAGEVRSQFAEDAVWRRIRESGSAVEMSTLLDEFRRYGSAKRETIVFYRDTPYEVRVSGVRDVDSSAHVYLSAYCYHADHAECRLECKTCKAPCRCECRATDRISRALIKTHTGT